MVRDNVMQDDGKVLTRCTWSIAGRQVCIDYWCHTIGVSKDKVCANRKLLAAGHDSLPEPLSRRVPQAREFAQLCKADSFFHGLYTDLAEFMPDSRTNDDGARAIPELSEVKVSIEHPLWKLCVACDGDAHGVVPVKFLNFMCATFSCL